VTIEGVFTGSVKAKPQNLRPCAGNAEDGPGRSELLPAGSGLTRRVLAVIVVTK